jgi:hypothetical protein
MDIPAEWLSSQVIFGAVLVVLAVVGVAFYFRVGARPAPAPADDDGAQPHDHARDEEYDHGEAAGRSGPGTYGPIAPVGPASVFETEPCWMGLLPGRSRPGSDASTGSTTDGAPGGAADPKSGSPSAQA